MALDLDKLNIVIEGNSNDAAAAVDILLDRLKDLKTIADLFKNEAFTKTFKNLSSSAQSASRSVGKLSSSFKNDVTKVASEAQEEVEETGEAVGWLGTRSKEAAQNLGVLSGAVAKVHGTSSKLLGTIKRVATMRLIRWAIRQVAQAAKEGLDILIEWDRTFGNNTSYAAKTVDELSAKWREVKKAVGAALMPLIQILQPVLNWVMGAVISIFNALNQILRSAQGFSTYMKATYVSTKGTTEAAKELRRVLFGFDELNVLNGQGGTGAAGSVSPIEFDPTEVEAIWAKVGESAKRVWEKIKTVAETTWENIKKGGDRAWSGMKLAAEGFAEGDWKKIWEGIRETGKGVWEILTSAGKAVWDEIKIYFEPIITWIDENILEPAKQGFLDAMTWIDDNVLSKITNLFKSVEKLFDEHPALATLFGFKKIDKTRYDFTVYINTDTKLSTNTQKLITLMNTFGIRDTKSAQNQIKSTIEASWNDSYYTGGSRDFTWRDLIGGFATGGDPEMGSLFFAGERGAEIVANTGSGTGVMNMKQMQDAVSNGNVQVVSAITAAVNVLTGVINSKDLNAYLDGRKITDDVAKRMNDRSRATGQPILVR